MQLTRWTSADTANQAPKATSAISGSWRTTWRTLFIRPNWLNLPRSPGSLPAADLCFASRAAHVRNYSPTIFFFLLGSVRTQQRCVRVAAAGLPWGSAHHRDRGVQRVWRARVRRPAGGQIRGQREGQRLTHAAIFFRPRAELQAWARLPGEYSSG